MKSIEPLTTDSTPAAVRAFFDFVFESEQSGVEFPVDFDLVWPVGYSRKDPAKRALVEDFFENEDYRFEVFHRNVENSQGGRPEEKIFLTTQCMEFFVARKVRPIFEIYRQCRLEVVRLHAAPPMQPRRIERRRTPQQLQDEFMLPILVRYIEANGDYAGRVLDLWNNIETATPGIASQQQWPKSVSRFGVCLYRLAPQLLQRGIECVHGARWGSGKRVELRQTHVLPAAPSVTQSVADLERVIVQQALELHRLKN